jgi:hypothetical protein
MRVTRQLICPCGHRWGIEYFVKRDKPARTLRKLRRRK